MIIHLKMFLNNVLYKERIVWQIGLSKRDQASYINNHYDVTSLVP